MENATKNTEGGNDRDAVNGRRRTALVTGGSHGLGRALAAELSDRGWRVIVDGRDGADLEAAAVLTHAIPVPGDVTDPRHRADLVAEVERRGGRLDLLVNNASTLGPSPLPPLADYPLDGLRETLETNVLAPLALAQAFAPMLRRAGGAIVNISSDAAVEGYEGWGGYGASKAALEQLSRVLAAEEPTLRVWWVDPGDMRTHMHQEAFPGQDISDRPDPETVAPALARIVEGRPPSGRIRLADVRAGAEK